MACLQPFAHITAVALQLWPYDGPHPKPRVQPAMLVGLLCGWGCWRRHPCTGDMLHRVNRAVFACTISVGLLSVWCWIVAFLQRAVMAEITCFLLGIRHCSGYLHGRCTCCLQLPCTAGLALCSSKLHQRASCTAWAGDIWRRGCQATL